MPADGERPRWHRSAAGRVLGLRYPIIQGPFGGGLSSAALTAEVRTSAASAPMARGRIRRRRSVTSSRTFDGKPARRSPSTCGCRWKIRGRRR